MDAPGDNLLAEFASAVDAVTGAVEIQRELAERNAKLSDERKMNFRIGVNVGDVVEEEDRIYGDGVNIAARIQEAAESNSVFVSQSLFEQVKRQSPYRFEDLGLHSLKNISEQIRLYKVIGDMPTHRLSAVAHQKDMRARQGFAKHRLQSCLSKSQVAMKISSTSLTGSPTTSLWNWHVSRNCLLARAVRALPMEHKASIRVRLAESWVLNTFSKGKSDALGIKCGSQYVS